MKKLLVPLLIALAPGFAGAIEPPGTEAEGQIKGSVADGVALTQKVFKKMGIKSTGSQTEDSGEKQTLEGRKGDLNVWVELDREDDDPQRTEVQVTAKKEGALEWNHDFAMKVLGNIVASS